MFAPGNLLEGATPFAVLVAEELFASGCEALVSISSASLNASDARPPLFVLIERALRDEGTSCHYLSPARYAEADIAPAGAVAQALAGTATPLLRGASWTTGAARAFFTRPRRSAPARPG